MEKEEEIKNEGLENKLQEENKKLKEEKNKLFYIIAEKDNLLKQKEKEIEATKHGALESMALKVINIRGDINRAIKQSLSTEHKDLLLNIDKEILKNLNSVNISPMNVKEGDEINSHFHEVLSVVHNPKLSGKINTVLEEGYFIGKKVLKNARVEVAEEKKEKDVLEKEPANKKEDI